MTEGFVGGGEGDIRKKTCTPVITDQLPKSMVYTQKVENILLCPVQNKCYIIFGQVPKMSYVMSVFTSVLSYRSRGTTLLQLDKIL